MFYAYQVAKTKWHFSEKTMTTTKSKFAVVINTVRQSMALIKGFIHKFTSSIVAENQAANYGLKKWKRGSQTSLEGY